ncbi:MAG: twin-arginine translocase TatA/TatE family subunit [Bacteroidales bacterium]
MTNGLITLFFNISGGELLVIILAIFIVFGPSKLPEMARKLGRLMNEVKKASGDITREFRQEAAAIEQSLKKTADEVLKETEPVVKAFQQDVEEISDSLRYNPEVNKENTSRETTNNENSEN